MIGFYSINNVGNKNLPSVTNLLGMENEFVKIGSYENALLNPKLDYEERQKVYVQIEESMKDLRAQHKEAFLKIPMKEKEKTQWSSMDGTKCALGKWLDDYETRST